MTGKKELCAAVNILAFVNVRSVEDILEGFENNPGRSFLLFQRKICLNLLEFLMEYNNTCLRIARLNKIWKIWKYFPRDPSLEN